MDENTKNNDEQNVAIEKNANEIPTDEEIYSFRNGLITLLFVTSVVIGFGGAIILPTLMNNTHKPAIYLYPEITQRIEIQLDRSIKYKNVIPKYNKKTGWVVEAEPSGNIRDLQPKHTECKKLPHKEFGFEYAQEACEINKYPYIYWDGVQLAKPLPDKKVGFHVKSDNIVSFLTEKADVLGLNTAEKKEFVRYWSKRMQETNWKYFRVYFLQNEEVDNYFPIKVTPEPKTSNRLQIVIRQAKKREKIEEQKLIPINRDGFTLVEWGGIIRK